MKTRVFIGILIIFIMVLSGCNNYKNSEAYKEYLEDIKIDTNAIGSEDKSVADESDAEKPIESQKDTSLSSEFSKEEPKEQSKEGLSVKINSVSYCLPEEDNIKFKETTSKEEKNQILQMWDEIAKCYRSLNSLVGEEYNACIRKEIEIEEDIKEKSQYYYQHVCISGKMESNQKDLPPDGAYVYVIIPDKEKLITNVPHRFLSFDYEQKKRSSVGFNEYASEFYENEFFDVEEFWIIVSKDSLSWQDQDLPTYGCTQDFSKQLNHNSFSREGLKCDLETFSNLDGIFIFKWKTGWIE